MEIIGVPEKLERAGREPFLPHGKSCWWRDSSAGSSALAPGQPKVGQSRFPERFPRLPGEIASCRLKHQQLWRLTWKERIPALPFYS